MAKRALLYLRRNYKRSILLLILLLIISFSLAVGLSVWGSIDGVVKEVQQTLGTSFNVKLRKESVYSGPMEQTTWFNGGVVSVYVGPQLDQDMIDFTMESGALSGYNADNTIHVFADDLELVGGQWARHLQRCLSDPERLEEALLNDHLTPHPTLELELVDAKLHARSTTVRGNTDTELCNQFRTGAFTLAEGRHIRQEDVGKTLISEEVASLNDLRVGDRIKITSRSGLNIFTDDKMKLCGEASLEIVGIFHVNGYQPINEWVTEGDMAYNWIMTDTATSNYFKEAFYDDFYMDYDRSADYDNVTFFVNDAAQLNEAIQKVEAALGEDADYYEIFADDTLYRSTVEPLNFIKTLVTVLTAIIVIGCMIVLAIVFTMWVKSRKKEIAIYLSMGLSKASIIGQLIVEALLVAAVACALAVLVARPAADAIGNGLLTSSIESAAPEEKQYTAEEIHEAAQVSGGISELFAYESGSYGGPEHIDFTFPVWAMLLLVVLEVLVILAAIGKASVFIFQLQPKQILSTLS